MKQSFWRHLAITAAATTLLVWGGAPAAAAAQEDTIEAARTGSLTIHKYDITGADRDGVDLGGAVSTGMENSAVEAALDSYAIEGVEFTYLRVADISTELQDGKLRVVYDLPKDLTKILGGSQVRYTGDSLNAAVEAMFSGDGRTASKNKIEDYIAAKKGTAMSLTDAQGVTSVSGLPLGLYLVVETRVPETVMSSVDPFFVSIPMTDPTGDRWIYDIAAYPKNQTDRPTLDKEVRSADDREAFGETATASEGDVLDFRILSDLPRITSQATYLSRYDYDDSMSAGIVYNEDTQIRFFASREDAEKERSPLAVWEDASPCFNIKYVKPGKDGRRHMKISMTAEGLAAINPDLSGAVMEIRYSGTLQSDDTTILGTDGNPNDVTLTWSRTNTNEYDTLTDTTKTYTFGIHLQKVFSDSKGDPGKVQFILRNETDGHYLTAKKDGGSYYVTGKASSEQKATLLSPGSDGWLDLAGVEAEDDYTLVEVKTDQGYTLLRDPVRIHIGQDGTASVDGSSAALTKRGSHENAMVLLTVRNTRDVDLPRTGGTGTLLFTLVGGAAVMAGAALISGSSKRRKDA